MKGEDDIDEATGINFAQINDNPRLVCNDEGRAEILFC